MKFVPQYNLWWPDFEGDPLRGLVRMTKRVTDCDVVAAKARTKGIAVQAGGHIGIWARQLAKQFAFVHTFEPIPETFECLKLNTQHCPNIIAHHNGLAATAGGTLDFIARDGGRSKVCTAPGSVQVPVTTIDALQLPRCDLIYLDVERYELEVLKGAVETIAHYRPVLALEVLDGQGEAVRSWAQVNNYTFAGKVHSDWMFTPL